MCLADLSGLVKTKTAHIYKLLQFCYRFMLCHRSFYDKIKVFKDDIIMFTDEGERAMVEVKYQTLGEAFVEDLELAKKTRNSLFDFLLKTIKKDAPSEEIHRLIKSLTDSESLINYYDVLARLQIERNSKTVNNIRRRLVGMHSLQKEKDSGYVGIMQKKLNILSAMTVGVMEHIYMIANCYIRDRGYGDVYDFKDEFLAYVDGCKYGAGRSVCNEKADHYIAVC